jgi:hypothetical protein
MATALEIVRGISQVLANSYDGALDEDGDPIKIGLKREQEVKITDRRVMDGFGCTIAGNRLKISYQCEHPLKEVHQDNKFESDIASMIESIKKFLTKEYKKVTGETLSLTKDGEVNILVQAISRQRTDVCAQQHYKIGGLKDVVGVEEVDRNKDPQIKDLDSAIKNFMQTAKDSYPGAKKPSNYSSKDEGGQTLKDLYKV